jgi:very-short-patch-repair endonuclease
MDMDIRAKARQLRKSMTDAEQHLWQYLRRRQIHGHKFRRQFPIGHYVVDFVCLEQKLVIEIDGGQHSRQQEYDARRTGFLESHDFRVIRFWNNEVLTETEAVLGIVEEALPGSPPP